MIERFYMRENLSFKSIELEFKNGLILFTGSSGAGKSVLMNAILGTIGQKESSSKLSEVIFNRSINLAEFGIESDDITVFKQIKKENIRYFINSQTVSKKVVSKIGKLFINHLNPRDIKEFDSDNLIGILDLMILSKNQNHQNLLNSYQNFFQEYENLNRSVRRLNLEINEMTQKEDFIKFEISKIDNIKPKIGEDKELQLIKKRLSKKDKIENYISETEIIFEKQMILFEIFDLMGFEEDSNRIEDFFEDTRSRIEDIQDKLSELNGTNIEKILDRIEQISELREKYSSIDKAIEYRDSKIDELKKLSKLRIERNIISEDISKIEKKLSSISIQISKKRGESLPIFEDTLNSYLSLLNLDQSNLEIQQGKFGDIGTDIGSLKVAKTDIDKLSYGEQNRVRLAILTLKTKFNSNENGTLFLDEIDANLSGDESMRVAKVLKELSKVYQVFAVSHQPQLTSQADQHFLVYKKNGESFVELLDSKEKRAKEIVRMVGGEISDQDVHRFAMSLLER